MIKVTEYTGGIYEPVPIKEAVKNSITVENLADTIANIVVMLHANNALTDENVEGLISFDKYNVQKDES